MTIQRLNGHGLLSVKDQCVNIQSSASSLLEIDLQTPAEEVFFDFPDAKSSEMKYRCRQQDLRAASW